MCFHLFQNPPPRLQKSLQTLEMNIFTCLDAIFLSLFNPLRCHKCFRAVLFSPKGHVNNSSVLCPSRWEWGCHCHCHVPGDSRWLWRVRSSRSRLLRLSLMGFSIIEMLGFFQGGEEQSCRGRSDIMAALRAFLVSPAPGQGSSLGVVGWDAGSSSLLGSAGLGSWAREKVTGVM